MIFAIELVVVDRAAATGADLELVLFAPSLDTSWKACPALPCSPAWWASPPAQ
jgi:hypothetical protein